MNKFRIAFAVTGVLFLLILGISPLKDYFREWKGYQKEYNALITTLPQRVKPVEIGIKQIWNQKLNRIDRCETCHLGITEQTMTNVPQPFTAHPVMYHQPEEFGCTVCHDGQGPATTVDEAHGKVEYWESPLLPIGFVEASCGKCHKEDNVPDAPVLTAGRKLLEESNCVGCHQIQGLPKQWVPSLDGIGTKVNRPWIVSWLKDPKEYDPQTRMPNFHLSDEEANTLADFLMTFKQFSGNARLDNLPAALAGSTLPQSLISEGTTKFREARCISCHSVSGRGGTTAPELERVASKVTKEWLYSYLGAPKRLQPGVLMPRYGLSDQERTAVVAYMENEFVDFGAEPPAPHTPDPGFYEKGLALFKKYNCAGCHSLSGIKRVQVMGPDLTFIGSKKLYEIDFGKSGIRETLPSYLFTKLKHPRVFSPTMKMPDYTFTDEQARAITVALLSRTNDPIPAPMTIPRAPETTFSPQGKFGKVLDQYACLGCHRMEGKGRAIGPELTLEASEATHKWIEGYFKVPYSLRPIMTERMPNLFIAPNDIKTVLNYMETEFIADSLSRQVPTDAATVSQGKILYYGTYGCQSCHQLNLKGGYVGPALDHVGSRLAPGWIYHWLKDPQGFRPETIQPNYNFSDKDADALAAYLSSLK